MNQSIRGFKRERDGSLVFTIISSQEDRNDGSIMEERSEKPIFQSVFPSRRDRRASMNERNTVTGNQTVWCFKSKRLD
jgi:hypothetical protein